MAWRITYGRRMATWPGGSYELVEWAVRVAEILGRTPAMPDEARAIMGLRG